MVVLKKHLERERLVPCVVSVQAVHSEPRISRESEFLIQKNNLLRNVLSKGCTIVYVWPNRVVRYICENLGYSSSFWIEISHLGAGLDVQQWLVVTLSHTELAAHIRVVEDFFY